VTVTQACTQAKRAGHTVSSTEVEQGFERWVANGRLFRHPAASRAAKPVHAYGLESPAAFVRQRLQLALDGNTQLTLVKLRACAPKEYRALVDDAIAVLVRAGQLFAKPGAKAKAYTTTPSPASSLLTAAQRKSLEVLLNKVNTLRPQRLGLDELLAFLDGSAPSATPATPAPTLALLEELYQLDLPTRGGLSSMPIPFTWRRYTQQLATRGAGPDRAAFEQLLLDSAASGRVELIAHEWPATLAPDDLAAAIRQPSGRVLYYWRPLEQQ
jgi:hypothetical protein